jgi:hypothetical protein
LLRAELDAWFARAYGLARKQIRYILDPADLTPRELQDILDPLEEVRDALDDDAYAKRVAASDFPGETFRVLKEKETGKFGEYRTRRLVLEAWDRLAGSGMGDELSPRSVRPIRASERPDVQAILRDAERWVEEKKRQGYTQKDFARGLKKFLETGESE